MSEEQRRKPLIKGQKAATKNGLASGRQKISRLSKNTEKTKSIPKENPLLSQPPESATIMKWFLARNAENKAYNDAHKEIDDAKRKESFEQISDEEFFHKHSRFTS